MTPEQLLSHFRVQVSDTARPYLWSDDEVYVYMDLAHKMFVRKTGGIFDVSSEACTVQITAGEKYSDLHPSILHIRKAVKDDFSEISVANVSDEQFMATYDYGVMKRLSNLEEVGRVEYMIIGEERNKCRWVRVPDADGEVSLTIARLPLSDVTESSDSFEIASEHHHYLVDYMKRLAYQKHDADAFNPKLSAEAEARFFAYCDYVWREWERYRHKPRSVAYGGI